MAPNQTPPGQAGGLAEDLAQCWLQLPNKAFFFSLLAAWLVLFQFLGSSVFAYVDNSSLFHWLWKDYCSTSDTNEDSQGVLILVAVPALLVWKRRELLGIPSRIWAPGLLLLAGCLMLHLVGYLIQQPRVSSVGFFCGIYALMGLAWGPAWMRASFFPLFLFAFAVPITGVGGPIASLTFHLRLLVTELVTFVCNTVLAIDVHRQGTQLFNGANTYSYEVAAACSGLRSLIAIFALCAIYGFMTFQKSWRRVSMMAAAIPLAVLGNMLRMLMIVIAAEIGGQSKGDYVHGSSIFSLLPYVPAILGILVMGHWLREKSAEPALPLNPNPAQ